MQYLTLASGLSVRKKEEEKKTVCNEKPSRRVSHTVCGSARELRRVARSFTSTLHLHSLFGIARCARASHFETLVGTLMTGHCVILLHNAMRSLHTVWTHWAHL